MSSRNGAVVIDNGSGFVKVGIAGNAAPNEVFIPVVGFLPNVSQLKEDESAIEESCSGKFWVADELFQLTDRSAPGQGFYRRLDVEYPIERGIIITEEHWKLLEEIWHYSFYSKDPDVRPNGKTKTGDCSNKYPPIHYPVILTESPCNPKANRERMVKIMFNHLEASFLYIQNTAVLSVFASGRTTGCVLDSGHHSTYTVAVYEGYILPHTLQQLDIGGRELNAFLAHHLRHVYFPSDQSLETEVPRRLLLGCWAKTPEIQYIKEELCYVAMNYEQELHSFSSQNVTWDLRNFQKEFGLYYDKEDLSLELDMSDCPDILFRCPEVLFRPQLLKMDDTSLNPNHQNVGVTEMVCKAITKCDQEIQSAMASNIVLSGGSTMFQGFEERLKMELKERRSTLDDATGNDLPSEWKIIAPENRHMSSWIGASAMIWLSDFTENHWISRQDYETHGAKVVHQKFVL